MTRKPTTEFQPGIGCWTIPADTVERLGSAEAWEVRGGGFEDRLDWLWPVARNRARYVQLCRTLSGRLRALLDAGTSKDDLAERLGTSKGTVTRLADGTRPFKAHWIPVLIFGLGIELSAGSFEAGDRLESEPGFRRSTGLAMIHGASTDDLEAVLAPFGVWNELEGR